MQGKLFKDDQMMELIDINKMISENIVEYNNEVIRKYFRKGILYAHKMKNGVAFQSYRGSVIVRLHAKESIVGMARSQGKRLNIDEIGKLFYKAAGDRDTFIVSRLAKEKPLQEIEDEFTEEVKRHLNL